jgi:4-amino-4-deoxy-L-arabinose transferase-like glycosyltransferase
MADQRGVFSPAPTTASKLSQTDLRILLSVLGLALLLRIAAVILAPSWYTTDSHIYHGMGQGILDGAPSARMPNGLPLLEAAMIWLLGDHAVIGVLAVNICASVATCAMVFLLARHYRGLRTAWVALAIMVVYPHTLNFVRFELTETLSMSLAVAGVWALARERYAWAGVAMGLMWLFRSSLLPIVLLTGLLLIAWPLAQARWPSVARFAAGFASIWLLHFALLQMHVVEPSANMTENILWSLSATSTEGIPFATGHKIEGMDAPVQYYLQFMWDHPGEWLQQRASSWWELMGPWPSAGLGPVARSVGARLVIGLHFVLLLLALGAAWRLRNRWTLMLFVPLIGIAGLHFFFFSEPRFLVPAEPFLMILAAAFCVQTYEQWRERRVV